MAVRMHPQSKSMQVADLIPAEYNPRTIGETAMKGLAASIERFGLVQPVIWNKRTERVVGGHQRLKVLVEQGVEKTSVIVVDLPKSEEKALNVALNSPAISGEFTDDLDALLVEIKDLEPELYGDLLLDQLLADAAFPEGEGQTDPDAVPDLPEDPVSERGKVYILGDHRLMCGDATDQADVAALLAGDAPFLMVTDPPYGVAYDPAWRKRAGVNKNEGRMGQVQNDDRVDWSEAWALFPGDVAYVWHAGKYAGDVATQLASCGFQVRTQLIWNKSRFALSRGHYHWQHEPMWYAVKKGKTSRWCGDRSQSTVWDIPLAGDLGDDKKGLGHGTQKPCECMARPIRHHGEQGDAVYEPFLGSGTTIIAAEKLDRRCYAMEIDPIYVDVARRRWAEFVHGPGCEWEGLTACQ